MCRTPLWLLVSLAFASLSSLADGAPMKVMSAPNLLRVGTAENIFVECQDCSEGDIKVEIRVMKHPTKTTKLANNTVLLNKENKFQNFGKIKIPVGDFSKDPNVKQYVYLQAHFPGQMLEKVVLVSFQSGYIFIQTDKTLYTPDSTVRYRIFGLTSSMEPVERDGATHTDASISIEFVTPEGIILPFDPVSLKSGMYSGDFLLGEIVSPGLWKVLAKFNSNPQQSYSSQFEVKEYVLPSFEVKLIPEFGFFYVDSKDFTVDIKATYLFGKEVDGTAYVVFGVVKEGQKKSFPSSLQRVPIRRGAGQVTLKGEHIGKPFEIAELVDDPLYVAVSVLTESGSEMVEAELRGIKIVTSPYTITFKKTPKYFKPGMTFHMAVEVVNPDETPANRVKVVVSHDDHEVQGTTAANGITKLTINTVAGNNNLRITAKTDDPRISPERQATATMTADPYKTESNNYIHIGVDTAELKVRDDMKFDLNFNGQQNHNQDITYLILSRGQLVKHGRFKMDGQVMISLQVPIQEDMLPSFRIIAYYHTNENEVVSDSVWVDVKDSCMGSLTLESTRSVASYKPRNMFGLKITGDPGATVGLVAVDKGVYVLNNKHRLTQKKVWDTVEKYDTGCTPGGGKDSMSVFYDAGLLFESSTASGTPHRLELKCPAPSRRKRAATITEVITSLTSQYKKGLQRDCCLDGMKDTPLSYTCEVRSEYITDGTVCVEAFLHCCKELESQRAERKQDSLVLARSEEDDSYMDSNDIVSRTKFPESWHWLPIDLPACPPRDPNCTATSFEQDIPLQDSITTWQFTGISLSRTHGICVGEPLEVIVKKEFFIDLRLPYSAVRGEQIEIKAILHNYSPDSITVRLDLIEREHVCSSASKKGRYRQEVQIGRETTRSVPFIIIPMKTGEYQIEVKAAVKDAFFSDGIMKLLRVVPEGELVKSPKIITLKPEGGTQEEILNSGIPKTELVPNTPTHTVISVTGREQVGALVENTIGGKSMGSLIFQPSGCGEQNIAKMTLPVIATTYLDKTNKWEAVGFNKRNEALQHIKTGYKNQLNYRKGDGSYALWADPQSSTWLTAYVAKVFAIAQSLVDIKTYEICGAVKFLILHAQLPDGMFREIGRVSQGQMTAADSDASMTAFCLIAMQESRTLCDTTVNSMPGSIAKAVAYLEKRLPHLTNPYAVAMTSYALANENKLNQDILNNFASSELDHWPVPNGDVYTREATAYALLALVKAENFENAERVVRWFNKQQSVGGGFGSTQTTMIVYQAIADYWTSAQEPDYNLDVDILLPIKSDPDKYNFNNDNHYVTRTSKMNDINQDIKVTAKGTGEATVKMVSLYYRSPKEEESDCQKFNLSVQLIKDKMDEDEMVYKLTIKTLYKGERDATMSILDIGLLTGFTVNTDDLNLLAKGHARTIAKYEMDTVLSERGSLIIYLDKVSHTREEEVTFRIHQKLKVGILQPAAVSVYDYYDRTRVKFYHPEKIAGELLVLCRGTECTCAEENCSMQKKGDIPNEQRKSKLCESTADSKIDFAYKVRVDGRKDSGTTDIYSMRVVQVIKEGTSDVGPLDKDRFFLSYPRCRVALGLQVGKTFLIMGKSKDVYRDDKHETYQYVIGEGSWIEYWPTRAECQTEEYRSTCVGIEDMATEYEFFGCQLK